MTSASRIIRHNWAFCSPVINSIAWEPFKRLGVLAGSVGYGS
jgi:hypothetical protein